MAVFGAEATISNTVFTGNTAPLGGALAVHSGGTLEMTDCLFSGNSADQGGAVYCTGSGQTTVTACTFADNQAPAAAALHIEQASGTALLMDNCLVAFNPGGEGIHWDGLETLELSDCDIFGHDGGDWVGPLADQLGLRGNFSADPLFCRELNPDLSHALGSGSPCAAAYDPLRGRVGALPVGCVLTDVGDAPPAKRILTCAPNPFNPRTTVAFELDAPGRVRLEIFDLAGRRVRGLVGGREMGAGRHAVDWDGVDDGGRAAAAGVYVCRLLADGVEARVRMALIR